MYKNKILLSIVGIAVLIAGCSTKNIQPRGRLDYLKATSVNPLELPPDLVGSQAGRENRTATLLSQYNSDVQHGSRTADRVLATSDMVRIERAGDMRWISTSLPADVVWTKSVQLWQELGLSVAVSNPEAGIAETGWMENRADVPDSFLRQMLSKALDNVFSSPTRDKFKLRLERSGDRVLVYVTHYGMRDKTTGQDDEFHTWVDRPRDMELEAEMLSRLAVKLGGREVTESLRSGAIAVDETGDTITVNRAFQPTWIQVGNLLDDGSEFKVESQDTAGRSYSVAWRDPKKKSGSKWAFWKSKKPIYHRFNVQVIEEGKNQTSVRVQALGKMPASLIMNRLRSNLY